MSRVPERIDVCIPTWNSGEVVGESLRQLSKSLESSPTTLDTLVVVDNVSEDDTVETIQSYADKNGWRTDIMIMETTLPEARQLAIQRANADWLLFLDDDVRLSSDYLQNLLDCVAPQVGAIQGRKTSNAEEPWEWVRRRVNRGGTHATLIRRSALEGLNIPSDLVVFEDEYIRRRVESNGYLWIFNHQARFEHDSMERHGIDWEQGYLTGKYGLMPGYVLLLAIGEGLVSDKPLGRRLVRLAGWIAGRIRYQLSNSR